MQIGETTPTNSTPSTPPDVPAFLVHGFGSGVDAGGRRHSERASILGLNGARLKQMRAVWRRDLEQDVSNGKSELRVGNVGGAAIALLSVLVIVICAGAVFALTQISYLKTEIAALQRELSPLRQRVAKAELADKAKQDANQQREAQLKSGVEKNRLGPDPRPEQAGLNLTSEEVRLILEYIKPAPVGGSPTATTVVGDAVTGPTIPFPSPVTEKVPKLLGARFSIKNGAIIIVRKDSRQADAVIGPH